MKLLSITTTALTASSVAVALATQVVPPNEAKFAYKRFERAQHFALRLDQKAWCQRWLGPRSSLKAEGDCIEEAASNGYERPTRLQLWVDTARLLYKL